MLIVGRGDEDELRDRGRRIWPGTCASSGWSTMPTKASAMRSADVYCAPHLGGESFGIVLVEAMAAGTPVVASDLHAFRRVLRDGEAGRLVTVDDSAALAEGLIAVLETSRWPRVMPRRALQRCAATTGRWWPIRSCGSTRRSPSAAARSRWRADVVDDWARRGLGCCCLPCCSGSVRGGFSTANRLDRLHVRYDLSWQALDAALARRAVVARAVAANAFGGHSDAAARELVLRADAAESAPRRAREGSENKLSAALATVDPASVPTGLIAELADAEARVVLARRFHNDAVRDTLALRERRLVRLFRLAGTAKLPTYFEIAERSQALAPCRSSAPPTGEPRRGSCCSTRPARCCCCADLTPRRPTRLAARRRGGGSPWAVRSVRGESLGQAAARELAEETGLRVDAADLIGPIWRRDAVFDFNGAEIDSEEFFFVHRTQRFEPSTAGRTELESRYIHGHRWCAPADIDELADAGETVYPLQLAELLAEATALAGSPDRPRQLQSIR